MPTPIWSKVPQRVSFATTVSTASYFVLCHRYEALSVYVGDACMYPVLHVLQSWFTMVRVVLGMMPCIAKNNDSFFEV